MADDKHAARAAAGRHIQPAGKHRAGVAAGTGTLAQVVGQHTPAAGVKEFAAVAGPVVQGGVVAAVAVHRYKAGVAAVAVMVVGLRGQQQVQLRRAAGGGQGHHRRAHRLAVHPHRAQQPFQHGHHAQQRAVAAVVAQPQVYLFDGVGAVHAPGGLHLDVTAAVVQRGVARRVLNAVVHARAAHTAADVPQFARAQVLQPEAFTLQVGQHIVVPRRQLVQAAVAGPAATAAGFRNNGAKVGVGQHVDPGARRGCSQANVKTVRTTGRIENAGRRQGCGPVGAGRLQATQQRGVLLVALGLGSVVPGHQVGDVLGQWAAVGIQAHAGQQRQRGLLGRRHVAGGQQEEPAGAARRFGARFAGVAVAQRLQFTLQRLQVGTRFAVQQHQVAGHTAPGPAQQPLHQRAHQPQAGCGRYQHHHQGPVARDAKAPQQSAVADGFGGVRGQRWRGRSWPRVQHQQQCGQRLHGYQLVGCQAHFTLAQCSQRGAELGRTLHAGGDAVTVHQRFKRGAFGRGRGGQCQLRGAVRRQR